MVWFLFAFLSAFFKSLHELSLKKILFDLDKFVLAGGSFLFTSFLLFLYSYFKGFPILGDKLYLSILITTLLNILMVILAFTALKITDLSLAAPISAFTPLFLIFTSFLILEELPNAYGAFGIFLVFIGCYLLNFNKGKNLFYPVQQIFVNKGVFYLFIVAFLASISINFDKLVVLNSDSSFGTAIVYFLLGISFVIISLIRNKFVLKLYFKNINKFLIVGFVIFLSSISINLAYGLQRATYVSAVNRLHILFAILL